MPKIRFNRFYRYPELTRLLKEYAKEYPDLIRLESIGKSHEGREVWLVTATHYQVRERYGEAGFLGGWQHPCLRSHGQRGRIVSDPFAGHKVQK